MALISVGLLVAACGGGASGSGPGDGTSGLPDGFESVDIGSRGVFPPPGTGGTTPPGTGDAVSDASADAVSDASDGGTTAPPSDADVVVSVPDGDGGIPDSVDPPPEDTWVPPDPGELGVHLIIPSQPLSGTVTIVAEVFKGDALVQGVEFTVDGFSIKEDGVLPYSVTINTQGHADGIHEIGAHTADHSGETASDIVEVTFDNSPPEFISYSPTDGATVFYEDGPLHLEAELDDPSSIEEVKFRVLGLEKGTFSSPPYQSDVPYIDLYIEEADIPKNMYIQMEATDILGQTTEVTLNAEVHSRLSWVYDEGVGEFDSGAVRLQNGNIVIVDRNGLVRAFNADGAIQWTQTVDGGAYNSPVVDPNTGNFYFGVSSSVGYVYSMDSSGSVIWTQELGSSPSGEGVVYSDRVFFASYKGKVASLYTSNGGVAWESTIPGDSTSGLAVSNDGETVYIGCKDNYFYAVNAGGVAWQFQTGDQVNSDPLVDSEGIVYFGSDDGWFYALYPDTGAHKWATEIEGRIEGRGYLDELEGEHGMMYVASTSHYITKLDVETGDKVWSEKVAYFDESSPVPGPDGVALYIGSGSQYDGVIYAVGREAGDILFSYPTGDTIHGTPIVASDRIFVGSLDRKFYSVWRHGADLFQGLAGEGEEEETD